MIRIKDDAQSIWHEAQTIGFFAGFQSLLNDAVTKSKPYYWLTFPKPPHKSVTHEIMNRLLKVIDEKNMPFLILTDDQPLYTRIVQIRNENSDKLKKIIPILGLFHTQVAFITSLTKRYEGSGLSDLIASASIIADKSIDQAMCGKHFQRMVWALQLVYEALQQQIIKHAMAKNAALPKDLKLQLEMLKNEN